MAVAGIVAVLALGLGAVVGLELAHRPVATVVELYAAVGVPSVLGLLNFATIRQVRYDLHNGVQDQIAAKAAELTSVAVGADAAKVAAALAAAAPDPPPATA